MGTKPLITALDDDGRRLMVLRVAGWVCRPRLRSHACWRALANASGVGLVGTLTLIALVAAGCGGASKTPAVASLGPTPTTTPSSGGPSRSAGTASGNTLALEFANCMHSHGVQNFPDPGGPIVPGIKQSPAFRSGMQTCNKLYPSSRSTVSPLTDAQRTAALAQARCIRDHGVPNIPDPTFPSTGGELFPAIPGLDADSPAFKHAAAACGLRGRWDSPMGAEDRSRRSALSACLCRVGKRSINGSIPTARRANT